MSTSAAFNRLDFFRSNLPRRYRSCTFTNLREHAGNRAAIKAAKALPATENLFIHGDAGNGKTHLAIATGMKFAETGLHVEFWGIAELFATIRRSFNDNLVPTPNLLLADVLILDDIGKVKPSEWVTQEIYAALEGRWADERATILTANHDPLTVAESLTTDSATVGAIVSRMSSGTTVHVTGLDERTSKGDRQ